MHPDWALASFGTHDYGHYTLIAVHAFQQLQQLTQPTRMASGLPIFSRSKGRTTCVTPCCSQDGSECSTGTTPVTDDSFSTDPPLHPQHPPLQCLSSTCCRHLPYPLAKIDLASLHNWPPIQLPTTSTPLPHKTSLPADAWPLNHLSTSLQSCAPFPFPPPPCAGITSRGSPEVLLVTATDSGCQLIGPKLPPPSICIKLRWQATTASCTRTKIHSRPILLTRPERSIRRMTRGEGLQIISCMPRCL